MNTKENGTYVAVRLDQRSKQILRHYLQLNSIPYDESSIDTAHVTIAYSHAHVDVPPVEYDNTQLIARGFEILGEEGDVLVLRVNNREVTERHFYLRKLGAEHQWHEYKPHITIKTNLTKEEAATALNPVGTVSLALSFLPDEVVEDIKK